MRIYNLIAVGAALAIVLSGCSTAPVDKTELQDLYDEAASMNIAYSSSESIEELEDAAGDASDLLDDEDATQDEVTEASQRLEDAIERAESDTSVDEFTVVDATMGQDDGYGYAEMSITVKNNTDDDKELTGVDVAELDADGNIINSYMSYNKNYQPTVLEPGQTMDINLTCATSDGIAGVRCTKYEYSYYGSPIIGELSEPFIKMF
ncbi:hypothetical protein B5G20_05130 [Collinsella sp. An7]|uniref:hypothetical protein n=1 Tax=Collinsella sp. An7 TaxID=1965651 RepID=UPI000B386D9F|nr:hypothetical protein [Collinsella sp. An7]OUN47351.1 hypothetical protein B5G20_05130 [Collinsella sp. An7]